MGEKMIEVNNIKKKIGDKLILDDISLNLEKGKIYGFRGRNGSGKTMLFRAMCGLITIDQGYIVVDGLKLDNTHFPTDIGLLLENPAFLPELTGYDNLEMIASIRKVVGKERIEEVLKIVGLIESKDKAFGKYSLGMKQRLAIGQAIMEYPKILMLDEPTNAIDEEGIRVLKDIVVSEKNKGTLVLLASHEKEIIDDLADEVFTMNDGRVTNHIIM